MAFEIDPIYYFIKHILQPLYYTDGYCYLEICVYLIRVLYITFYISQITRILCFVFTITLLYLWFAVTTIKNIKRLAVQGTSGRFQNLQKYLGFLYYQCFIVTTRLSGYILDAIALFAMAAGGIAIIISSFTTVKLHHVIPMPMFLAFPCMSILCPIFGSKALNLAAKCNVISKKFKTLWLKTLDTNPASKWNGKMSQYWRRKCSTLFPFACKVGVNDLIFCRIDRSTSPRFWYEVLYYSITAILSLKV